MDILYLLDEQLNVRYIFKKRMNVGVMYSSILNTGDLVYLFWDILLGFIKILKCRWPHLSNVNKIYLNILRTTSNMNYNLSIYRSYQTCIYKSAGRRLSTVVG